MGYSSSEIFTSVAVVAVSFIINAFTSAVTCVFPGMLYVELLAAFPDQSSGVVAMGVSIVAAVTWGIGELLLLLMMMLLLLLLMMLMLMLLLIMLWMTLLMLLLMMMLLLLLLCYVNLYSRELAPFAY